MLSDALKKVFYAGIGVAAVTVEKTGEVMDKLEVKGQEAVREGKAVSGEVKQKLSSVGAGAKDAMDSIQKLSREQLQQLKARLAELANVVDVTGEEVKTDAQTVIDSLGKMSREELDAVKARLDELSQKWTDGNDQGDGEQ
jgi:polyhydroxyalkanoate synthesis regulator phasin